MFRLTADISGHQLTLLTLLLGGIVGLLFFQWSLRKNRIHEKLIHTNRVLDAIRNVDHLLTRAKDRRSLIQGICDTLVANRSYFSIWAALLSEADEWHTFVEAGLGDDFKPIVARLQKGVLVACCRKALRQPDVVVTDEPTTLCGECPLTTRYQDHGAISARIAYDGQIYGLITLSVPKELIYDTDEKELVREVATDMAFGLRAFELEKKRRITKKALQDSMQALNERIKELNCLYEISNLVERHSLSLEAILQGTLDLIPPAFRMPEKTGARITLDDGHYQTENFKETVWKIENEIIVDSRPAGNLTICWLETTDNGADDPFINEENNLIRAVAERLGKIIERHRAQIALQESEKRFRTLVENSLTGISIIQDNQVVYQNKELERLLGPLPRSDILGDYENIHPLDVKKVKKLSHGIISGNIQALDVEFRYALKGDLENPIWIYCRAHKIEFRQQESILVNMMDLTEVKALEKLLLVQDKMASLGRVTAGIAHEIRNPLSGINIYLNTLEKFFDRGEREVKVKNVFRHLQSASAKIESVIRRVMDFSKPGEPNFYAASINGPVAEAINLTAVTLRKCNIILEKNLSPDLPDCRLDPQLIEEVILNLINNAADAMKGLQGEKKIKIASSLANDCVIVRVLDSGPGVPPEVRDKLFDPFFTTKPDSTGIGLSICHRIITDHRGTLSVQKSEWNGAEFIISIPAI